MIKNIVAVVINFNSAQYIFDCIESLLKQTIKPIIVVVDNNSSDGSEERLSTLANQGKIHHIYLDKNIGSSAANNLGISKYEADAYLIINADIILDDNYVAGCVNELNKNYETGAVAGKLLNYYRRDIIDGCGVDLCYEGIPIERGHGQNESHPAYKFRTVVFSVCCAAALYRSTALKVTRINGQCFDEQYFAFYEDLDLSCRLNLKGYDNVYIPNVVAYHVRGGSTKKQSDFVQYLCIKNSDIFYYRYLSPIFKYKLMRVLQLIHRLFIYDWKMLIKVRSEIDKKNLEQLDLALLSGVMDRFVNKSYYIYKIKSFFTLVLN